MPNYYTYLISSLPMLQLGAKPPLTIEKFFSLCQDFISPEEIATLKITGYPSDFAYKGTQDTLRKWFSFERKLRNELVKIRSSRKKLDASKYFREDNGYVEPFISHLAIAAYRNPSLLESEKILDEARWRYLDELSPGHYFDLDFLIIYTLKLSILKRWETIAEADNKQLLETALGKD